MMIARPAPLRPAQGTNLLDGDTVPSRQRWKPQNPRPAGDAAVPIRSLALGRRPGRVVERHRATWILREILLF
jgi:hypothetical protein